MAHKTYMVNGAIRATPRSQEESLGVVAVDAPNPTEAQRQWRSWVHRTYQPYSSIMWWVAEVVWQHQASLELVQPEPPEFPHYVDSQGREHAEF